MPSRHLWNAFLVALALAGPLASPLAAAPPSPILPTLFSFPGAFTVPASARSAGVALADRWLGDDPAGNPAGRFGRAVQLSPMLLHVSRQDLRAENTAFDETPAFLDAAGGWIGLPIGDMQLSIYAHQPVSRSEDNAYEIGRYFDPTPPGVVQSRTSQRELRGGVGLSFPFVAGRLGVAGEWTHREDSFDYDEQSGSPQAGTRHVEYSGDGVGGQVGLQMAFGTSRLEGEDAGEPTVVFGASARYVPELTLDGSLDYVLLAGDSTGAFSVVRESGFEGGASMRVLVTRQTAVVAGAGGRTEQAWQGFDVTSGKGAAWAVGVEFHDPRDPWGVRIGYGNEQMSDVPENRAATIGLGFSYAIEGGMIDLGVVRRSFERAGRPTAFEDRVIGSVRIGL